jgi:tRNA (guanine-N7-)-methyltransferase
MQRFFDLHAEIPPDSREEATAWFERLFGALRPLTVEIGSGNGHYLTARAQAEPERNFAGTEILGGRARKFQAKIEKRELGNIAVFKGDSRRFVWEYLYAGMVDEFVFMFPDPWPKKRHHKHRILRVPFIRMMHLRLVHGGRIQVVTDHTPYRDAILAEFEAAGGFSSRFENGHTEYAGNLPPSLFEQRFRDWGRKIHFMEFRKESPA